MEWIDIKDELPIDLKEVLLYDPSTNDYVDDEEGLSLVFQGYKLSKKWYN